MTNNLGWKYLTKFVVKLQKHLLMAAVVEQLQQHGLEQALIL